MNLKQERKFFTQCEAMRKAGYTVIIWTPEETEGVANLRYLDDRITQLGNETIEDMQGGL